MEPKNNIEDELNVENEGVESPVDISEAEQAVCDSPEVAIVDLQSELDKANAKAAKNWEKVLLATAEVENIRRRSQKDLENAHRFAVEKFAKDLLAVVDSFEIGLSTMKPATGEDVAAIKEGMELTYKQLMSALEKANLTQIDPQGEAFNPDLHQAMTMVPSDEHAHNTVIQVFQKGYLLNGRLLRPAMVVVSQGGAAKSEPGQAKKIDEQT